MNAAVLINIEPVLRPGSEKVVVNEMPNFTGVRAMPRLMTGLEALNVQIISRRDTYSAVAASSLTSSWDDIVFNHHVVGRYISVFVAIEIGFSDVQRIDIQVRGNAIDYAFNTHHPLRASKPSEGGI